MSGGTVQRRPMAPRVLGAEEADVWRETVQAMPATWFPEETHQTLMRYCRHVVRAHRIDQLIDAMEALPLADSLPPVETELEDQAHGGALKRSHAGEGGIAFRVEAYAALLRMAQAETRHIAMLATKMRLTQQSTLKREEKGKGVGKRPWADV